MIDDNQINGNIFIDKILSIKYPHALFTSFYPVGNWCLYWKILGKKDKLFIHSLDNRKTIIDITLFLFGDN